MGRRVLVVIVLVAIFVLARVSVARADPVTLSGSWSASALGEKWTVAEWGDACGPKPKPQGAGGGSVQIREQGGELSIVGAGRAFSTSECWEQMPGLSRASHSASKRFWRTTCTSAANDPRRARVVTTISASDDAITLNETGSYQFIIQDTTCNASVVRSRSFTLVHREGDTAPAPSASASAGPSAAPVASAPPPPTATTPPPRPEPKPGRCAGGAGDPARLEVTPSRKLMRAGDKFTFRVATFDVEGCPVGARPTWSIVAGPLASKATIDNKGELSVAADAEGKLEVTATLSEKGVTIPVEVASAENYDALLAASGLNESGEADQAAVAVIATGTIGGKTSIAEDSAKARKTMFVAIVAALAMSLGFVGLILARRGRRRAELEDEYEEVEVEVPEPVIEGQPPRADTPKPAMVKVKVKRKKQPAPRGKICPTCGERYGSEAAFCGKDGAVLVMLN